MVLHSSLRQFVIAIGAALALGASSSALAFTITADISPTADRTHNTTTTLTGAVAPQAGTLTGYAGRFAGTVTSGGNAITDSFIGGADGIWSWCIDPQQYIDQVAGDYEVSSLAASSFAQLGSADRKQDLAALFGTLIDFNTGRVTTTEDTVLGLTARDRMTAFQVALWEIAQETAGGLATDVGNFVAVSSNNASGVRAQANAWLASVSTGNFTAREDLRFWVLDASVDAGGGQSQIAISVVPLPAAAWLFGTALLVIAGFNSRKPRRRLV